MKRERKKRVSFRIRRQYYDAIVRGDKKQELRKYSSFWKKRLLCKDPPEIAVFVCGKRVHRRFIKRICVAKPEVVLGRDLSPQGRRDIPTELCISVELGRPFTLFDVEIEGDT